MIVQRQLLLHLDDKKTMSKESISDLISHIEYKSRENQQIMYEQQMECLKNWFALRSDQAWETKYIYTQNKEQNYVLLRFLAIQLDILCNVHNLDDHHIGDKLELRFSKYNNITKFMIFEYF